MPFHSANDFNRIQRLRLIAIAPVLLAAVINTGYQFLLALRQVDDEADLGWRYGLTEFFSPDLVHPGAVDIIIAGLIHVLPVFAMALLAGGFFERLFAEKRNRPFDTGVIYTALLFTLLMPPGVVMLHIVFAMAFAIIFAHGVFGGEGKSFLNPALVAVAVAQISFPGALTNDPLWTNINGYAGTRDLANVHEQGLSAVDWWSAFLGNSQGFDGDHVGTGDYDRRGAVVIRSNRFVAFAGRIVAWRVCNGDDL